MQNDSATQNDSSLSAAEAASPSPRVRTSRWRVVDIVVAAVLGVAIGLVFWAWNAIGGLWFEGMNALTPGFGGIAVGIWLIGGVVGGLIIRKPGAAVLVEVIGAIISALIGNAWGISTIYSGLAQGLGAEIVFAVFAYRFFGPGVAALAGAGAGAGAWLLEFLLYGNIAKSVEFNTIYLGSLLVSGAILAGLLGWMLVRGLAATGALSRFAVGREGRREV